MKKYTWFFGLFCIICVCAVVYILKDRLWDGQSLPAWTAAEAAVRHVRAMEDANFNMEDNSAQATQTVKLADQVLVLVQYHGFLSNGRLRLCEMIVAMKQGAFNRLQVKDGAGLCHRIDDPSDSVPISVVSSSNRLTLLIGGYSAVHGYVRDAQIAKIRITWNDGLEQDATLQGSTYLAARDGRFLLQQIETWNDQGKLVFSARPGMIPQTANH